jgi:hypothetical protein
MLKKQLVLLLTLLVVVPLAQVVMAQEAPAKAKEARWEGRIHSSDKDKSILTVRRSGGNVERTEREQLYPW